MSSNPRTLHGARRGRFASRTRATLQGGDSGGSGLFIALDPQYEARQAGKRILEALDPGKAPSKVKRFCDMSPTEQAAMRALYEGKP